MLTTLHIENFALVKKLELDFSSGMTAFTGETGAGKSIMIDALMLALGERADSSVVRRGEDKCEISACFTLEMDSDPSAWLLQHDIACDEGHVILRRVVYAEGRSKSYINGQPFPLQQVKEFSEMLVHIHGQHQHQTLMQHTTHRQQLDQYAGHHDLLHAVATSYKKLQAVKNALGALLEHEQARRQIDLFQFQIEELDALNPQAGEIENLSKQHQQLHHAQDYLQHSQKIISLLNADDEINLCKGLHRTLEHLDELPSEHKTVKTALELINSALIQCQEAVNEIQQFTNQVQLDPEHLFQIEARMSQLYQMARKHQVEVSYLPNYRIALQDQLHNLQQNINQEMHLKEEYQQLLQEFEQNALTLRKSRQLHAQRLASEISAIICQLGMPHGEITINISPLEKMHPHGQDKVEYTVSTNPGSLPEVLQKIASGGELSRISLAIQMITAQRGATPTLFFDEVDVGIGGATAALVGKLLRRLGERLQVFCVTHQPQVASCAHHHFIVEKFSKNEQTFSTIRTLSQTDKIDEIARMLSGLSITEQTRLNAKALLFEHT